MFLEDIERIEVITSPLSALYGANSFGGMINIITKSTEKLKGLRVDARIGEKETQEYHIRYAGKVGKLKNRLLHYSVRDYEHLMSKSCLYAWLGGKKRYEAGVHGGGLWGASIRAVLVFLQIYILRRGFMDGSVGFLIAVMYSQTAFNKYASLWTLRRKP